MCKIKEKSNKILPKIDAKIQIKNQTTKKLKKNWNKQKGEKIKF